MNQESQNWRKYERKIYEELSNIFVDCDFQFDDLIFGKYSKTDRQIDIAIRGEIGGNNVLGIIECKYFANNIDVKIVESFIGMIDDVQANFGLIITNKGFSDAARNRATQKNLKLEIIEFNHLQQAKITYDYFINKRIHNLKLSRHDFYKRATQNWAGFNELKSSYEKRELIFKENYVNTEYYAHKKTIEFGARFFRDFNDLDIITIKIPSIRNDKSTNWKDEKRIYSCTIKRHQLEDFLKIDFSDLRFDIDIWRKKFIENKDYSKQTIIDFAIRNIKSKVYNDYDKEIN
jgi:hypothetical protein